MKSMLLCFCSLLDDQQCALVPFLCRFHHLCSTPIAIHHIDRIHKTVAETAGACSFPGIAVKQERIADRGQDLVAFREVHGPEQADLRLDLC